MCDFQAKDSCQHIFSKGVHKGQQCQVIPHSATIRYCAKHRTLMVHNSETKKPSNSLETAKNSISEPTPPPQTPSVPLPMECGQDNGYPLEDQIDCPPMDKGSVEENTWLDPYASYYDWTEHNFNPVHDTWGSDNVTWSPSVYNY